MNPGATHFFRFLLYLFLALFAAESQSLLIAALVPVFVAALALASFANGLWMVGSPPSRCSPRGELTPRTSAVRARLLYPGDFASAVLVLHGTLHREAFCCATLSRTACD